MNSNALDASAFYAGIPFLSSFEKYYTSQAVFDEVKHIKKSHGAIEALREAGSLQVIDPDNESMVKVKATAMKTGDFARLSQADFSIIALAFQLKIALVTDDYSAANVATTLKIPVKSTSSKGIREIRKWVSYCSACGKSFGAATIECRLCGNKLRRKYKVS